MAAHQQDEQAFHNQKGPTQLMGLLMLVPYQTGSQRAERRTTNRHFRCFTGTGRSELLN